MKIKIALLTTFIFISCPGEENEAVPTKITLQDIYQHANVWVSKCFATLSSEDQNFVANIFHLDLQTLSNEIKLKNSIVFAHAQAGRINFLINAQEEEAKKVSLACAIALKKLNEEFLPACNATRKAIAACKQTLEKSTNTELQQVIAGYQKYMQAILAQFAKQDSPTIETIIQDCKNSYSKNLEALNSYNDIFQAILEHRNPYLTKDQEPESVNLNVALSLAESALINLQDMIMNTNRVKQMSLDVLNISKFVTQVFYSAIYEKLQNDNKLPVLVMFNEQGLIPLEERWQDLPMPENLPALKA